VGIIQPTNEITVENLVMVWLHSIFGTGYFIGFFGLGYAITITMWYGFGDLLLIGFKPHD
jgi:uncharacterized RDD family membrane protein YckC